jgi:uncharacterized damage-inducible protein DinB
MNEALRYSIGHNGWATRELIAACRNLSEEQLTTPAIGSFDSILRTFNHIILSDAGYLRSLSGSGPDWLGGRVESADFAVLLARVEETERSWQHFLEAPFDAERLILLDQGAYEAHADVLIAQAIYHGHAHREQICAILTGYGIEPPDLQGWAYGEATGRGRERTAGA